MKKLLLLAAASLSLSFTANAEATTEATPEKKCASEKCHKSAEKCTAKLEEAFNKHDADKDGKLTLVEFKALTAECEKSTCDKGSCDKDKKCSESKCDKGSCDKTEAATKDCKKCDTEKECAKCEE